MSNNKLRSAIFSVNEFVKQITNYSHASRADTRHMLHRCMKDLHELGFKIGHLKGLQAKHIYNLVKLWQEQNKNPATIKNYMSKLRKVAETLGKPELVKSSNDHYHIARRSYAPSHNKAIYQLDLSKCIDPHIRLSLEAQLLFGLRREESMKLVISEAWQGTRLHIKPSWTKGGKGRTLTIINDEQKQWLIKVSQQLKPGESLIPKERTYKQHLSCYQQQTLKMGINKLHGLRHAYAQRRYHELTYQFDSLGKGLLCPIAGGKPRHLLSKYEKYIDRRARLIISRELGHSRISITRIYWLKVFFRLTANP
jgi:hypothetical protein